MVILVGIKAGAIRAGNVVVGNMVAYALELTSDIWKLLSSSLVRKGLYTYDALLGSNDSVLLMVVASMKTSYLVIDGGLN